MRETPFKMRETTAGSTKKPRKHRLGGVPELLCRLTEKYDFNEKLKAVLPEKSVTKGDKTGAASGSGSPPPDMHVVSGGLHRAAFAVNGAGL